MLEVICNSVQCYLYNPIKARVVAYHYDVADENIARFLASVDRVDKVSHEPNIKYDIEYFTNEDLKIPAMSKDFEFTNVVYKDKVVRSFIGDGYFKGLGVPDHREKAEQFKAGLEKYGIKLF